MPDPSFDPPQYLTTTEAAKLIGCHRSTVCRAIRTGALPVSFLRGNRQIVSRADVLAWSRRGIDTKEEDAA